MRTLLIPFLLASTACASPLTPTALAPLTALTPSIIESIRIEGSTGGACISVDNFYARWDVYRQDIQPHVVTATAYRDPTPGCAPVNADPLALRPLTTAISTNTAFLLDAGRQCGHARFALFVDGVEWTSTIVNFGRPC